ncbi:hypothetical protein FOVG_19420 [Fusarium oxysporum f. sp. pisi HDV247]|uniref:Uncharacterized protein n=2 Tax=Fusarium oxysporum TaxID=5507 RepID=A0A420PX45_FUSOX|nr:hypothetical protein FOVG_19599 [Fusarium oxysporum f. sp. pisi HDV247]EXA29016.1 hypothetical protein FOVG_19420 [Fusarium oxysporum f. sp. pisi HDV247]RKK97098.1 hypothetical protein BFJ68_g14107 [Fusarium oxysporum]
MDQGFSASPHLSFAETQAFVDSWNQTMNPAPLPVQNQLYLRPLPEQHHGYNTPPLSDPGASSLPMGPPGGAGNPQSCTLNLVVRAEHMENNSQSSETNSQIAGRLDRLGRELETFSGIVADLKTSLIHLEDKMESQRTAHEEEVRTSIEKIKKGMDKFFTCFANQLESEMIDTEERSGCKAEVAIM